MMRGAERDRERHDAKRGVGRPGFGGVAAALESIADWHARSRGSIMVGGQMLVLGTSMARMRVAVHGRWAGEGDGAQ